MAGIQSGKTGRSCIRHQDLCRPLVSEFDIQGPYRHSGHQMMQVEPYLLKIFGKTAPREVISTNCRHRAQVDKHPSLTLVTPLHISGVNVEVDAILAIYF